MKDVKARIDRLEHMAATLTDLHMAAQEQADMYAGMLMELVAVKEALMAELVMEESTRPTPPRPPFLGPVRGARRAPRLNVRQVG